jgi:hypothetical protein
VKLSLNPSEAPPHDDGTSANSSCNHPGLWEASLQSRLLEVVHALDPSNVVIQELSAIPNDIPEPDAAIAANVVPDLELMLP